MDDMMVGDDLMGLAPTAAGRRRHTGPLALWCDGCGRYNGSETYTRECPACGEMMWHERCTRCGHIWVPKDPYKAPGLCPACKSPYFMRPRMHETVERLNERIRLKGAEQ